MSDSASQPDDVLGSFEKPAVPHILRDNSTLVSGTEQELIASLISPEVAEGAQVFPPHDEASKASPSTTYILNPMTSNSSSGSSSSAISQGSRKSQRSTGSGIDVFLDVRGLTDEEQEKATRFRKGSRRDTHAKRTAPYKRKSGGSMAAQTMSRLAADHAYQEQVAARFFTYHPESNVYSVHKRNGITLDCGTHLKKGAFVSECGLAQSIRWRLSPNSCWWYKYIPRVICCVASSGRR